MSTLCSRRSTLYSNRSFPLCSPLIATAFGFAAFSFSIEASGNSVSLEWDPVDDVRVAVYEICWGTQSGQYQSTQATASTSTTIENLTEGETYYFAAKACDATGTICSSFSEELSTTVDYAAPVAGFTESTTSGVAPLTLTFDDASEGKVETYTWEFGDGNRSTAATAVHTYDSAGTYTVSLTVAGPGGTATETKTGLITVSASDSVSDSDDGSGDGSGSTDDPTVVDSGLPLEAGEVTVDHNWKRVEFARAFTDPVVVATSVSGVGGDPVTVRIDAVDQTGFSIRLQEWEYLDDWHIAETVGYLVVERGSHQFPNGAWLEADELPVGTGNAWQSGSFITPFATAPVVLSTVATYNDATAVTTRLRAIEAFGFELMLQGEEANGMAHGSEMVSYVASESFCGELNGQHVIIGKTADEVTNNPTLVDFTDQCASLTNGFTPVPTFLAEMQTTDGADTANVRWNNKHSGSIEFWVDEEQSKNHETAHTSEVVGYLAIGDATPTAPLVMELGEVEVGDAWQRVDLQQRFSDPIVVAKLMTARDAEPALIRIKDVDPTGFTLRVQEWDYLDGTHALELVSYMVVERGRHQLPSGNWIEAGRMETSATNTFTTVPFSASFQTAPVVITSVATANDTAAVTTRLNNISATSFEAGLIEEDASDQVHATETIGYVALEPASFVMDGFSFEVARTADAITDFPTEIGFAVQGTELPLLFGEMQSKDGGDPSSLRADQVDHGIATIWVEEEQSMDTETWHTSETAGYLVVY